VCPSAKHWDYCRSGHRGREPPGQRHARWHPSRPSHRRKLERRGPRQPTLASTTATGAPWRWRRAAPKKEGGVQGIEFAKERGGGRPRRREEAKRDGARGNVGPTPRRGVSRRSGRSWHGSPHASSATSLSKWGGRALTQGRFACVAGSLGERGSPRKPRWARHPDIGRLLVREDGRRKRRKGARKVLQDVASIAVTAVAPPRVSSANQSEDEYWRTALRKRLSRRAAGPVSAESSGFGACHRVAAPDHARLVA